MVVAMKRLIFPIALLTFSLLAWAQSFPQGHRILRRQPHHQGQDDPADAAEHGVARLSLANGSINVIRGDSGESVGATVNEPLVTSDRVSTGEGSRAEVQFDSANMIRLGANTDVRMGDLQYHRYLVQINQGTTLFRVLRDTDAQVEISTPSVSVAPLRQGIYRVTVRPDGSSEITVRAGEADLISPSGTERLSAGQAMLSRGSANDPEIMSVAALPYDEWDRWNADRDRFFERAPDVSRYAPPDIDGAQELSNYGRWVQDPSYGNVWVPGNVGPDWAPYRDGRWDYLDYYGWSWTSYDPWGWAPYHYGNWYRGSFGWAWYPGAIGPRHYWRPAMVGFFGFGEPGFGASLGFGYGNVGWVPLAPFERYRPWYGRGYSGGRNVNIVNNTNIVNVYRNARVNGAVTGLRAGDFGRAGVGRNSFVRPDSGDLARAGMVNGGMPFAPARNLGSGNGARSNNLGRSNSPGGFYNPGGSNNPEGLTRRASNIVRLNGGSNGGFPNAGTSNAGPSNSGGFANRGGWRRLDSQPSAPAVSGNRSDVRVFSSPRETQQPVRISPPIVNNRNEAPANFRGPNGSPDNGAPRNGFGGFGGPRPNGGPGFGAPPAQRAAPVQQASPAPAGPRGDGGFYRAPQGGGGVRSAPPSGGGGGGGPRGNGGGGGGGNRGGGSHGDGQAGGHGR